jgi:hypothetical protein
MALKENIFLGLFFVCVLTSVVLFTLASDNDLDSTTPWYITAIAFGIISMIMLYYITDGNEAPLYILGGLILPTIGIIKLYDYGNLSPEEKELRKRDKPFYTIMIIIGFLVLLTGCAIIYFRRGFFGNYLERRKVKIRTKTLEKEKETAGKKKIVDDAADAASAIKDAASARDKIAADKAAKKAVRAEERAEKKAEAAEERAEKKAEAAEERAEKKAEAAAEKAEKAERVAEKKLNDMFDGDNSRITARRETERRDLENLAKKMKKLNAETSEKRSLRRDIKIIE